MIDKSKPSNIVRKTIDAVSSPIHTFVKLEASSAILLFFMAVIAMICANTHFISDVYFKFINLPIHLNVGNLSLNKTLLLFVNDGLMAIFFYLVGLEIKREILVGELSTPKKASFSIFAAIGGMIFPALVFIFLNSNTPARNGWGIPMATDIAFALGVLALLGKNIPAVLKVFLLALAIVDDLGAISIIALFYTKEIAANYLGFAGISLFLLFLLNFAGFRNLVIGIVLGFITWFCFLKSGVHATLAGVILAFLTPAHSVGSDKSIDETKPLLLDNYIHSMHPWVAFLILPIFAFFNAGVNVISVDISSIVLSPVSLGVILGLIAGKPIGIFIFTYFPTKLGWTSLPENTTWIHVISIGFVAGIGFTMSLFINSLAYNQPELAIQAKIGILLASVIAAILGSSLLWLSFIKNKHK
ncbi:MAG: Na+/H+ antiporter NhaA [Bdellovibrionaceae bacterium]|nr:Na+/H+ antiporter NhaA [Pseudobdellovibrionaceae bacterium]